MSKIETWFARIKKFAVRSVILKVRLCVYFIKFVIWYQKQKFKSIKTWNNIYKIVLWWCATSCVNLSLVQSMIWLLSCIFEIFIIFNIINSNECFSTSFVAIFCNYSPVLSTDHHESDADLKCYNISSKSCMKQWLHMLLAFYLVILVPYWKHDANIWSSINNNYFCNSVDANHTYFLRDMFEFSVVLAWTYFRSFDHIFCMILLQYVSLLDLVVVLLLQPSVLPTTFTFTLSIVTIHENHANNVKRSVSPKTML